MSSRRVGQKEVKSDFLYHDVNAGSYLETAAWSLVDYADEEKSFAKEFKKILRSKNWLPPDESGLEVPYNRCEILKPIIREAAKQRLEWVIKEIDKQRMSDNPDPAIKAQKILSLGLSSPIKDSPQVVIGLIGVAVPGPTAGIIKKRKTIDLTVIVRPGFPEQRNHKDAMGVSEAVLNFSAEQIKQAGGLIKNLEPEVGQWFMEDRKMDLFEADEDELLRIKQELDDYQIGYGKGEANNRLSALAVSPTVNKFYQLFQWNIVRRSLNTKRR